MFLKRIEMQGFKSFADKVVIQFDHDVTGIVGPNGAEKQHHRRDPLGLRRTVREVLARQCDDRRHLCRRADRRMVNMAEVTLCL